MKTTIAKKSGQSDATVILITSPADLLKFETIGANLRNNVLKMIQKSGIKFDEKMERTFSFNDDDTSNGVWVTLGKTKDVTIEEIRKTVAFAIKKLSEFKPETVSLFIPEIKGLDYVQTVKAAVEGFILASYSFDKYISKKANKIKSLSINTFSYSRKINDAVNEAVTLAESTNIARDLVNEPANIIYPETLAKEAQKLSKKYGFTAEIYEEKAIKKLGMEAFLAVARAAEKRPRLIVLKHFGDPKSKEITALVGKGLTYDTGGLALKTAEGMAAMKCDMGGAASVIGAMCAISAMKLKVNAVAVIAACENSIGGNAYRNGDIISSMAGKTIEVLNTDAEGRLTLIDAVTYAVRIQKATKIVDVATLTGAVLIALGNTTTGVVSNNDAFFRQLENASAASGEQVWRLPDFPEYSEMLKSKIADLQNIGKNRMAGTITGGLFIGEFVEGRPWLHLDIAGTAWRDADESYNPAGGTGAGVRLLYHLMK
ncbi:MAG TPA: leucyl aminopeptidase [bacterium]|nr:leucyl aminopeptidase [bacterium]